MHGHRTGCDSVVVKIKKVVGLLGHEPTSHMSCSSAELFYLHKDCKTAPRNAVSPA